MMARGKQRWRGRLGRPAWVAPGCPGQRGGLSGWADCGSVHRSVTGGSQTHSRAHFAHSRTAAGAFKQGPRRPAPRPRGPASSPAQPPRPAWPPPAGPPGAARPLADRAAAWANHAGRWPSTQWERGGRGGRRVRTGPYCGPAPATRGPPSSDLGFPGAPGVLAWGATLACAGSLGGLLPPGGCAPLPPAGLAGLPRGRCSPAPPRPRAPGPSNLDQEEEALCCRGNVIIVGESALRYKRETQNLRDGPLGERGATSGRAFCETKASPGPRGRSGWGPRRGGPASPCLPLPQPRSREERFRE
ncbi:collagen alpha-1(III) chain-like [Mirounga angustirostris]|uniref:collagen alpha-1(III) chain-like n=1 Tax=Mirounga angustirostris TaxID=9716 RepID=UPI00313CBDB9